MAALTIRIKKNTDGTSALSCTRADGSVTWQSNHGQVGRFFPRHDLTHYAVETLLKHRRGFYGLVAEGWDMTDFGTPWPRGPLPADADPSELIVGFFDAERAGNVRWTAAELKEKIALYNEVHHTDVVIDITDDQLAAIRQRRAELFAMWDAIAPGEALELPFELPENIGA
jgi:hypothetical protein